MCATPQPPNTCPSLVRVYLIIKHRNHFFVIFYNWFALILQHIHEMVSREVSSALLTKTFWSSLQIWLMVCFKELQNLLTYNSIMKYSVPLSNTELYISKYNIIKMCFRKHRKYIPNSTLLHIYSNQLIVNFNNFRSFTRDSKRKCLSLYSSYTFQMKNQMMSRNLCWVGIRYAVCLWQ